MLNVFELTRFTLHQFIDIDSVHAAKYVESEGKDSEKRTNSTIKDAPTKPAKKDKPATEDEIIDLSKLFKGPPLFYTGLKGDAVTLNELAELCVKKAIGEVSTHFLGHQLKKNKGNTKYTGKVVMRDGVKKGHGIAGWKIAGV